MVCCQEQNISFYALRNTFTTEGRWEDMLMQTHAQWRTEGGFGVFNPPHEIPKALQNRAKLNPIVKTVKNC